MRREDCFYLGTLTRTHGKNGGLVAKLETDQPEHYSKMESVLIDLQDELVPFFISQSQALNNDQIVLKFDEVNWQQAQQMVGLELYLPLALLPKLDGKKFYYHEVEGFRVKDHKAGELGSVSYILERPGQPLFVIENGENEIFIPAIDDFIDTIDRSAKTITLNCPEGLIDIFTSKPQA